MLTNVILVIAVSAIIISVMAVFAISEDRDTRNKYIKEWQRERDRERWDGKDKR